MRTLTLIPNSTTFPITDGQYSVLCKRHGKVPFSEILGDGTTVYHWIGPGSAEKPIIYVHGTSKILSRD
jgi:hypothetical protein